MDVVEDDVDVTHDDVLLVTGCVVQWGGAIGSHSHSPDVSFQTDFVNTPTLAAGYGSGIAV
jgi:hypothetical protein